MPESFKTRWQRRGFNFFPAYRRTGGRLTYLADDYHEIHVKLPLSWRTRNYVGTIFGGSMYGAIDPVYMIMLIKILGGEGANRLQQVLRSQKQLTYGASADLDTYKILSRVLEHRKHGLDIIPMGRSTARQLALELVE